MASKRVLLTGAGGFVGAHVLAHILRTTDWEVVALDSFNRAMQSEYARIMALGAEDERVLRLTHDLRQPLQSSAIPIDYVFSVASASNVDLSIEDPRPFVENNVALMLTLLEWARDYRPEKFIHVSTAEVYGAVQAGEDDPAEGSPHRPSNPYSASKAAQDDLAYAWWRTYDLPVAVCQAMNVYGQTQDPSKFVPKVLGKVLAGDTVGIHASAEGQPGTRFYQHARNLADALVFVAREVPVHGHASGQPFTSFHVVGEREVDNLEMARLIAEAAGRELRHELVDFHGSRPGHDLRYALDGAKLAAAGWKPPVAFEESLASTIRWTVDHPEWLAT